MADHHRDDLARQGHGDGSCGFLLDIQPLENLLAALGKGGLTVEAESQGSGERSELRHYDIVLPQPVLWSSRLFFGSTDVGGFLDSLRLLAERTTRAEKTRATACTC